MLAAALAQGCYYIVSGLWPLIHMESFQKVTGRKTDLWLVNTVGLLLIAVGAGLLVAAWRQEFGAGLVVIAIASAAALLAIEVTYVLKRVISPIYMADGAIEAGFIVWWAVHL